MTDTKFKVGCTYRLRAGGTARVRNVSNDRPTFPVEGEIIVATDPGDEGIHASWRADGRYLNNGRDDVSDLMPGELPDTAFNVGETYLLVGVGLTGKVLRVDPSRVLYLLEGEIKDAKTGAVWPGSWTREGKFCATRVADEDFNEMFGRGNK